MLRPALLLPPKRLSTPRSARRFSPPSWGLLPGAPVPTRTGLPPAGLIKLPGRTTWLLYQASSRLQLRSEQGDESPCQTGCYPNYEHDARQGVHPHRDGRSLVRQRVAEELGNPKGTRLSEGSGTLRGPQGSRSPERASQCRGTDMVHRQPVSKQLGSVKAPLHPPLHHCHRAEQDSRSPVRGATHRVVSPGVAPFVPEHRQQLRLAQALDQPLADEHRGVPDPGAEGLWCVYIQKSQPLDVRLAGELGNSRPGRHRRQTKRSPCRGRQDPAQPHPPCRHPCGADDHGES